MYRPPKRQRLEHPVSWLDCESFTSVCSKLASVVAPCSDHVESLFLDRFEKEIVKKLGLAFPRETSLDDLGPEDEANKSKRKAIHEITKKRVLIGTNACTRILEELLPARQRIKERSGKQKPSAPNTTKPGVGKPSLVVMALDGVEEGERPWPAVSQSVAAFSHIPRMADKLNVPILLLSKDSARELARILKLRTVSVLSFVSKPEIATTSDTKGPVTPQEIDSIHKRVDSFVSFMLKTAGLSEK